MAFEGLSQNELLVLLAAAHVGTDAYGVSIAKGIEEASGYQLSLASVYDALQRLEAMGLVRTHLGEATAERGGRAKRIVEITRAGRLQVQAHPTLRQLGFAYQT